jgi:hypothetical protein
MNPEALDELVAEWMVELVLWHRGVESIVDICGECNRVKVCLARHGHEHQGDWVELDIKPTKRCPNSQPRRSCTRCSPLLNYIGFVDGTEAVLGTRNRLLGSRSIAAPAKQLSIFFIVLME